MSKNQLRNARENSGNYPSPKNSKTQLLTLGHILGIFGSNFDAKTMRLYLILAKICKAMPNKKIKAEKWAKIH